MNVFLTSSFSSFVSNTLAKLHRFLAASLNSCVRSLCQLSSSVKAETATLSGQAICSERSWKRTDSTSESEAEARWRARAAARRWEGEVGWEDRREVMCEEREEVSEGRQRRVRTEE